MSALPQPNSADYRIAAGDPSQNYSNANSGVNAPRAVVIINGVRVIPTAYKIMRNAHGAADTADITFSMAGNPDWSLATQYGNGPNLGTAQNPSTAVLVEIWAGYGGAQGSTDTTQLSRRFFGIFDSFTPHGVPDEVAFSCRSLAALLIASRITTQLAYTQSTSSFVQAAAASVGLRYNIALAPGSTPSTLSQVFAADLIFGVHNMRKWDVIIKAAQYDAVDVWVADDVLNYANPDVIQRQRIGIQYGSDLVDWEGKHAPQFSKNIHVEVRTYNPRTKVAHVSGVRTDANGNANPFSNTRVATSTPLVGQAGSTSTSSSINDITGGTTQSQTSTTITGGAFTSGQTTIPSTIESTERYFVYRPNISPAAADALALQLWQQYSQFEFTSTLTMAMTPEVLSYADITTVFMLVDVPVSLFNSSGSAPYYFVRRFTESFSVGQTPGGQSEGWTIVFDCVNHPLPQGEV